MAQREDLEMESGAGSDAAPEHRKQGKQDGHHCEQSLFGSVRKFNIINPYGVSGRHRTAWTAWTGRTAPECAGRRDVAPQADPMGARSKFRRCLTCRFAKLQRDRPRERPTRMECEFSRYCCSRRSAGVRSLCMGARSQAADATDWHLHAEMRSIRRIGRAPAVVRQIIMTARS